MAKSVKKLAAVENDVIRHLTGRKIARVTIAMFDDGRGSRAHFPTLILDDGSRVTFLVEETDVGEYGIEIVVTKN